MRPDIFTIEKLLPRLRHLLALAIVLLFTHQSFAQINACAGGVITGGSIMTQLGVPAGHQKDGYWSQTAGLTFSSINEANAIISGFVAGQTYTIEWTYKNKIQKYSYTFTATNNAITAATLNGGITDLLLCSDAAVALDANPDNQTSYEFFVRSNSTGISTSVDYKSGNPIATRDEHNLTTGEYEPLDEVFAIVESANNCKSKSNEITISNVSNIQVQVVGGVSVCPLVPVAPYEKLEVIPFAPSSGFTYTWHLPSGATLTNVATVDINAVGNYYVTVTGPCTGGPWTSNTVSVTSGTLPNVTITAPDICATNPVAVPITSTVSGGTILTYTWEWLRNGFEESTLGTSSSTSTDVVGNYQARLVSTTDKECHKESNVEVIAFNEITGATFSRGNGPSFCASSAAISRTPVVVLNISGGTAPYTVVLAANGTNMPAITVPTSNSNSGISLSAISANTTYSVVSITDATGCAMAASLLPATIAYTVEPTPTVQTVTYTGGCTGSALTASLLTTQAGVTYYFRRDGANIQSAAGGGAVNFTINPATAGTYDVTATGASGTCPAVTMSGSITVGALPNDQTFSAGPICRGGTLTLSNSETGVRYYLLNNGIRTGAFQDGTSGSALSFGGLAAGTYTVEAVRGGCTRTLSGSITVLADATPYTLSANQTTYCQNVAPTGVNLSLSDSEAGYNYTLQRNVGAGFVSYGASVAGTGNALTNQWTNIPNGIYQVVATSTVGGCTTTMLNQVTISQLALPTATVSNSLPNSRCAGASTTFNVNVALTGSQPFNFDIVNNAGLPTINVSNFYGNVYTVSVNPTASTTFSVVNLRDANACSVVAGTGQAVFNVNPAPVVNFSSLPNPIATNASGVPSTPVCLGSNVTLTANVNNTPGAKTYIWSDALGNTSTVNFAPNVTRQYTVTVTNEYGCSTVSPVEVVVNPLPIVDFSFSTGSSEVCEDVASVQLIPTAPNTGGGFTILPNTAGAVVGNFFYPPVGGVGRHFITYSFVSTDGCSNAATHYIDVNPLPPAIIRNLQPQYCADAGTVTINSTPQSNADGQWSVVGFAALPGWFTEQADGSASFNVTAAYAAAGPHQYEVVFKFTDPTTGCARSVSQVTEILDDLDNNIDFRNLPASSCQTGSSVLLEAFFNTTNALIGGGTFSGPGITDHGNGTATFDPATAGNGNHTITYNYTDANGCSGSISHTTQIGTVLSINVQPNYCKTNAAVNVYGSPASGTLRIYQTAVAPANLLATKVNSSVADPYVFDPSSPAVTGVYVFVYEYTDGSGCVNTLTQNVTVAAILDASFTLPGGITQFCKSKPSVILTPTTPGGFFSGPGVTLNIFSPSVAGVGTHTVTYSINTGSCNYTSSQDLTVTDLDILSIDNLANTYCDNETGPFLIQPNNLPGAAGSVYTFSSSLNATGKSPLYTIVGGVRVYATSITASQCYFDPAIVGAGWYTVTLTYDNSVNNACTTVYSKTVQVFPAVGVNFGGIADPIQYCMDAGDVTLLGSFESTGNYTGAGNFSGPAGVTDAVANDGAAIFNPAGLAAGIYPVTYTLTLPAAQGGCTTSRTKSFEVLSTPVVYNVTPSNPLAGHYCDGGVGITIGVDDSQNNVTYQLIYNSDFTTPAQTFIATGGSFDFATPVTQEGIYTVQAVSADGCKVMMTGSVEVIKNKVALTINTTDVKCNGGNDGEIEIIAAGGSAPYTYTNDGGTTWVASNVFSSLTANHYGVNVIDAIGCTFAVDFDVVVNEPVAPLGLTPAVTTPVGCACAAGTCDGAASVVISGGTPFPNTVYPEGYKIDWLDASNTVVATSSNATGLAAGNYLLVVTDQANCVATQNVTITTEPALTLVEDMSGHQDVICHGASTGVIRVVAGGGSGATEYQFSRDNVIWYSNGTDTYSFTNLPQGTYKIYVRNAKYPRCTAQLLVDAIISQPTQIVVNEVTHTDMSCYGVSDGSIEVAAAGGLSGDFRYSIDGGVTFLNSTGIFTGLADGDYQIYAKDNTYGCVSTASPVIRIEEPALFTFGVTDVVDVTCRGGNDGSAKAYVNGGTLPYTYRWTNKATTALVSTSDIATGLSAGVYTLVVTDVNNCNPTSVDVTIGEPATGMVITVTPVNASCACTSGACDGSASMVVTNIAPIQTITWSNGASNVYSINGLDPGVYSVTVTDVNGCTSTQGFTIGTEPALTLSEDLTQHVNITCNGATTGSFTVIATGGSNSYEYSIDGTAWQGSATFSNLDNGSYTVQVRDANHPTCTYTMVGQVVITEPAPLTLNEVMASHVNVNCYGSATGALEVVATGGSGTYQYSIDGTTWPVAPNSPIFSGLIAGNYRIYVRDDASTSCITSLATPITISQPPVLSFTYTKKDITCYGSANGEITVTAFGGSGTYEYSKDNGATWQAGNTFVGLSPSVNQVVVRDINAATCQTAAQTVSIVQPASAMTAVVTKVDASCSSGAKDGSATIVVTNIAPIQSISWSNGASNVNSVSGLEPGTYSVLVTDVNGCTLTSSFTIGTLPALTLSEVSHVNILCNGATTGSLTVLAGGGSGSYEYSINNGTAWQSSATFSGLDNGSYTVQVRDALHPACTFTMGSQIVITEPTALTINEVLASHKNVSCYGSADGSLEVVATGGSGTYNYSKDGITWTVAPNSPIFSGLIAGTYRIYVRDAASTSCSISLAMPITISQPSVLSFTYTKKDVTCKGSGNGEITISAFGGSGTYEYSKDNGLTWQADNKFINLSPGTSQLRVRDINANNCQTASQSVTISEPATAMTAVVTKVDASCSSGANDGTATIVVTNIAPIQSISWSNGASNVNSVSGLAPGVYSVLVTDVNGCTLNTPFTVSTLPALTLTETLASHINISCNGATTGSFTVSATGGSGSYEYSINGTAWQSSATFSGLDNGSYTVRVRDANHPTCTYTMVSQVVITEPAALTINEVLASHKNVSCYGSADGSLEVVATGGSGTYNYSKDGITWTVAPNSPIFSGLTAGTYRIYVRDAGSTTCVTSLATPITISQPPVLSFTYTKKDVTCKGSGNGEITISAFGGSGTYEYSRDNGLTWQAGSKFINLSPGTSQLRVRDINANTCQTASQSVTISEPATAMTAVVTKVDASCSTGASDGTATIVVTNIAPIQSISWSNGSSNVNSVSGLAPGTYSVLVTDVNGCTLNTPFTISTLPALTLSEVLASHVNITCNGATTGSLRVTATGGSGSYEYSLNGTAWQSSSTFSGLDNDTYTVRVRDALHPSCSFTMGSQIIITEPAPLTINEILASHINVNCYGSANGSLEVVAGGGSGTYNYSKDGITWTVAPNSPIFSGLTAGTYRIYVRDASSTTCVTSLATPITISQPPVLSFTYTKKDVTCKGSGNGEITISAFGGSGTYEYSRDNGLTWQAGNKFINLSPGTSQLRVRDINANTCQTASQSVTISEPATTMTAVVTKVDASCSSGAKDGSATIVVTNIAPIQSISWSNGASNVNSVSGLAPGAYSVLVTDVNGCTLNTPFTISTLSALTLTETLASHVNISCNGATTGSFTVAATGGSGSYEYSINGTAWQSSATFSGLDNGSYTVQVRDALHPACTFTMGSQIIITEPTALTINEVIGSHVNVSCNGLNDGALEVVASGGSATYNYSKDGVTWTVAPNSPIFTGLFAGSYRIYVRDAASTSCLTSVATPITISQPVALSFNYAKKDVSCFGDLSGEITVTAFGGSGSYEYSIDNGIKWQDNNVFTGLASGSYNIVVRNKNATGCKTVAQVVTISQPAVAIDATLKSQVNVKCYGASTGQIVLDPVPAGASLQYSIDGGVSWSLTTTFNNLKAGTYTVMVKNATCQNNNALIVVITEPAASLSISNSSSANITCASNSSSGITGNGTANVTLSGGVTPYTYQWINTGNGNPVSAGNVINTANSSTISNMLDGTYRIDITDANSCAVSRSFTITKPGDWNIVHTSTNVTVVGASDGSINITSIAGGTGPYKITWADGTAYNDMTSRSNLAKGTYSFTITDASGCTYTRSVVISDNQALSVTFKGTDIKCFGSKTGHIDVNVSNGVPGYQLTWSGLTATGATPSGTVNNVPVVYTLANLEAGTYTLTIRDNNGAGATVSQIIVINQPTTPVSIAVSKTDVVCNGNNNGTIDVRATGGTPFAANTYDISIIPGSTVHLNSHVFTNLVPGAYSVVAVDSYGCSASQNATITEPLPLSVTFTQTNVDCNGASTGSLTAKVNGRSPATSFRYDWYTVSGGTQTTYLLNGPATITNLIAATYRVIVTAGSCSVTADAVITQNTAVTAVSKISNVTTCKGDNTGSISLTLSGGVAPYLITYNVGGNPVTVSTIANVYEITGLYAGNYNILVADSKGCSTTLSNQVVTEPAMLAVTGVKTNIDCTTPSTGTLNFNIAGGLTLSAKHRYSVTLNGPNGYSTTQILSPAAGAITPVAYNALNAGNYTLVVQDALSTDADRCQVIESFTLSHITIEGTMVQPTCQGLNKGEITNIVISGAQPGYTATWSTVDGSGLDLTSLPQAGLTAGTYRLTVVEPAATGRGCTVTRDFVLTNQRVPTVDGAVADVTCHGGNNGSITAIVASDMTINQYNWSGPGITNNALPEQLNLVVGTYQLEVTDADGCMATRTFDVHEPTAINYNLTSTLDNCNPHSSSIQLTNITGGTGTVYHYYWQGPGIVATTANLTGLTKAGLYTVTVSDDNNCQLVKSLYVTEGIQLDTAVVRPMCFGGTNGSILVTATGGSGNFKYTWSRNGVVIPTETTAAISNIGAGTYRAVVTDLTESVSGVSCSQSIDIVIKDKAPFVIDESITPISCNGDTNGAINITVSGGTPSYQYLWSGAGVNASAEDQSGLKGGTYSVTITDQNGCKASESYVITEPAALAFDLKVTQTTCAGVSGELEVLNATGGTKLATTPFYNFQWAGPGVLPVNTTTTKVSNLIAGDYTVQMSDLNGCKLTKSATLYSAIEATYSVKPQTCSNMPDGQIDLTVSGGVAPYTYAWTTIDGGNLVAGVEDQSGLASGTYSVTISDSRIPACQLVINNIVVKLQSQLLVTGKVQPVLCFGNATGAIKLTVAGGIGTYSYVWSGPGIASQPTDPLNVTGLIKGNYQVIVTDNTSGCQEMKQFTVEGPDALLAIDNITTTNVLCYGNTTGEIMVSAVGGTPYGTSPNEFYKYLWTGPIWLDSIANQVNLPAGNYTVRVKDGNGCLSDVSSVVVTQPAQPLSISLNEIIDVTVTGSSTGVIDISSAGGSGNHTYHWEECSSTGTFIAALPNTGTRIDNLSAGFYRVTVTDDNGCSLASDIYPVTEPGAPLTIVLNIYKDIRPCNGDANGELAVNITGGTPDMSTGTAQYEIKLYRDGVLLSTTNGTSLTRNDLTEGVYDIVATDANGIIAKLQQLISEPAVLELTYDWQQNVTCYNGADGSIRVYVHGGQPSSANRYQLSITGPKEQTVVTVPVGFYEFKNLSAGLYRIELIDDANGDGSFVANGAAEGDCHQVLSDIEITQPEAHVVLSGDAVVCEGYNNSNNYVTLQLITTNWPDIASNPLTVTLSNGVPLTVNASPYFFSYEATSSEFLEITSVKIVNCQKGTYSGSAMIDYKSRPDARIVGDATICSGETTPLTFYFDGVVPWSVTYNNGSADIVVNNIQTSPYVVNVNPSVNTTYTVKSVTDKYCTTDFSQLLAYPKATVQVNSLPTSVISGNATICEGQSTNLTFTLTGKAPWQVTYVADGVEQTIPDIMSSPYVVAVTPLQSASYVLKHVLDANGCEQDVSGSVLVTVNPQPDDPGVITGSLEVCQGESGVKYSIAAVTNDPGNTYIWTLPSGFTLTSGAGSTAITLDVSKNAVNGVIKVAVVNACGTSSLSSEIYVTVNPLPNKPAPIVGPVKVCQGATGIIYSIPATTNATSYIWSVPAGFNIVSGQGTTTIQVDMDPSQASVFGNITVTAVNDCGLGVVSDNLLVGIDPLPAVFAGTDENICLPSHIMKATIPGANCTGSWTVKSGAALFSLPNANNSPVSNIAKGENVFEWTVRNNVTGCVSTDEVKITNNQLVVTASANLYESCTGGATILGTAIESGDTKTKGLWTFANNSTGVFSNAAANQTTVSNLSSGSVILRWTLTRNGCASSADVAILNNKPAQASIVNKLAVAERCVDSVQLIAQPIEANSSGRWNVISGSGVFDKPLSTTVNVTGLMKDTVNRFSWTVSRGGCSVTDYVNVRNNQIVWTAGTDQTVCNDYTALGGQIPRTELRGNVLWTVNRGNGSFANAMDARTRVDNLAFGENVFQWTVTKNGCVSFDTVSVFSYKPSKATILTGNLSNCADTAVIEAVVPTPLNGLGYWGVTSGSGQIDALTASKTIVRGLKKGDNTLRWSVTANGCTDYTEIKVTNKLVEVDAGRDFSSCSNIVKLSATAAPSGTTGEWSVVSNMGSGLFDPDNNTATATVYGISSLRDANDDMLRGNVFVWTITKDGCQSTDTVVVTYNGKDTNPSQSFTAGNDVDINLSTYTMAASPLNKDEVGTWTIVSGGGNFKDVHSPTTVVSSLVQGANVFRWTVTYNGCSWSDEVTVVNGQVTPANAGLDQTVCEDVVTLHANEPNGVGKGEWSIVQGSGDFINKSDPQTKVRYLGMGNNIFRWTISYNGSSSSKDEVTITNNMPQTANAGVDDMTCSDWYQLEGNDPNGRGVATWSIINGGGSLGIQAPSMRVTNLSQGTNIFKYEINNKGCTSIDSVKIINGLPTAPNAGVDRTICIDSIQLIPNNPTFGTGEWRIAEGFAQTPMTNNWAKQLAPGINKFVWVITTDYQCTLTDTVTIISNKPTTSFAGYNQDICGDTAKLLGNDTEGKGIGTWYRITGSGSIDNPLNANTIVRSLGRGSNRFRWVIDNQGCTSSSDVEVVNNLIVANSGYAQTLCADSAVISGNTAFPGVGTWGVLSGSQGAKFDNPDEAYTVVRNLDRGENVLTWTIDYKGCQSVSKLSITNNMPTDANAGPNVKTCNDYVTLSAGAVSQGTGSWTIRNGGGTFDDLTSPTANVTSLSVGSNIFRWTTEYKGCSSTDDVEVAANTIKAIVGPDQPNLCSNTTTLQANNAAPGVGTWSVNGGGVSQATFEDVNNPNTVVSNLGKGQNTLRWTIINEGCPSFAELVVVNNSPSASYAGNSQEVCDAQVVLDATEVPAGTGVGHWEVLTGSAKISDLNNAKATVTELSQGDNVFRWSVVNGTCIDNDEVLIVNNKPSTPYAGNDEELCNSDYQLKAGVPEFGSGNWSIFKGSGTIDKPNSPETSISNVGYNENVFIWTITQGQCQLTDSVKLINNTPTKAQAGPDVQDCKSIIELDANIPAQGLGTGFWTLISGKGAFSDATNAKTSVYDLGFGENILQWTITKGNCFSSDQISVFNKVPDQALAGSDRTICENYVVLNANNPESGSGSWSVLSGQGEFEDKTRFDTKVKSVGFGKNQYKWTIAYGECVTEDIVVVTSNKAYPYAGEDDVVYRPNYSLKASNPGNLKGQWTLLGGGGDFDNSSFFNTAVSNLNEGVNTYRWTIDVNGCVAYDDVSITYKLIPDAGFVVDTAKGCYPLTVQFTNYSLGGNVYNWDFGDGKTSADRNPKHIYTDEGEYTAVLTIPGPDGNDDVFSQRISVYGHPKAEFNVSPSTVYIPGESVRCYNLTNDARSYVWDFGDGTTSTEPTPMHEYQDEGVYDMSLTAINQYGCEDVFYIYRAVEAIKQGFIVFPNAFAPRPDVSNGVEQPNGVNEVFRPKYKDIDTYHLQIFDRWGQLIYESDDITLGWDGTYKNNPSAQDVYVFKAWGTFISGKEFRVTGNVLLVK